MARDTASSLILHESINTSIQESEEARILCTGYDLFIFPELSPDGRMLGNSQLSASGADLSQISLISRSLHPELFYFQRAIKNIDLKHTIDMILHFSDCQDCKGHSVDWKTSIIHREMPLFWGEFCANLSVDFKSEKQSPFIKSIEKELPQTSIFQLNIGSFDNGYSHYFSPDDYKRFSRDMLHATAMYCACKIPRLAKSLEKSSTFRQFSSLAENTLKLIQASEKWKELIKYENIEEQSEIYQPASLSPSNSVKSLSNISKNVSPKVNNSSSLRRASTISKHIKRIETNKTKQTSSLGRNKIIPGPKIDFLYSLWGKKGKKNITPKITVAQNKARIENIVSPSTKPNPIVYKIQHSRKQKATRQYDYVVRVRNNKVLLSEQKLEKKENQQKIGNTEEQLPQLPNRKKLKTLTVAKKTIALNTVENCSHCSNLTDEQIETNKQIRLRTIKGSLIKNSFK